MSVCFVYCFIFGKELSVTGYALYKSHIIISLCYVLDTEFDPNIFQGIIYWPQLLANKMRLALISKGPTEFQNLKGHFKPREKPGVMS